MRAISLIAAVFLFAGNASADTLATVDYPAVQELGRFGDVTASQLNQRECATFSNYVALKKVGDDPFVSPRRPDLRALTREIARSLTEQCLGDGERVNYVDFFTWTSPDHVSDVSGRRLLTHLVKVKDVGGRHEFLVQDAAIEYIASLEEASQAQELACESGRVTYTREAPGDGAGALPHHWAGTLAGARQVYSESGLEREHEREFTAELRFTDDRRPFLAFEDFYGTCRMRLAPQDSQGTADDGPTRLFDVIPYGQASGSQCDHIRELLEEGGNAHIGIARTDNLALDIDYESRTVTGEFFGDYETEEYGGTLTPRYTDCMPKRTPKQHAEALIVMGILAGVAAADLLGNLPASADRDAVRDELSARAEGAIRQDMEANRKMLGR